MAENLAFALKNAKMSREVIRERVAFAARALQLDELLERRPGALSGGQRQRVAMGRAIVREPRIFCMDEPLSNLDAKLRGSTRAEIAQLQRRLGVTTIYVTHDQVEAMTMADRVAVLESGKLQQVVRPIDLYRQPDNVFVASFIGSPAISLLDVAFDGVAVAIGSALLPVAPHIRSQAGARITVGLRPEAWRLVRPSEPGLDVHVDLVEQLGAESFMYATVAQHNTRRIDFCSVVDNNRIAVHLERNQRVGVNDVVRIAPATAEVLYFDVVTGRALR
ncbi:ABC transporter ATP-binding protein [Arcanobacterium phocisimile]|uniref:ABC transporter ATP-binding protein n=1 Tax=Arcanobacterium phocisimile TaxID=1302235 RepID=UPI0023BB1109|nr:ATP-binding cassette domain-containing protein [Arcanobacterium phocisimile]